MNAPSSGGWSELPVDILRYVLELLSFFDFHRAKMVCLNWYLCSKQTLRPKFRYPLVMLCPEEGGCRLYNPEEDRVYKSDLSGYQLLGNSGKWFLVVDSKSDLYIVDVFSSDDRILLPRLETLKGGTHEIQRVGENDFKENLIRRGTAFAWGHHTSKDLRGLVWVDDKNEDYVVVWRVSTCQYLGFCKKGDAHYGEITLGTDVVRRELRGGDDIVLKGYNLYLLSSRRYIRHLDLSGQDGGIKDASVYHKFPMSIPIADERVMNAYKPISVGNNIVVPTSGEPLFLYTRVDEPTSGRPRFFRLYKRDAKDLDPGTIDTWLVEVDSLGDEALFFDLGITVPADHTLGIEPNSIYFTRNDRRRFSHTKRLTPCIDVCVYNLATKNIKRFASLSNLKINDAMWFLPS
ncbi:unnamed protein product [Eruca vesicaria subsp. sativa]|uniref:F-box domain-containing protein n=1 Tax=Eruca vesicaria subsp. sativa TaxID=29727 RepID=A0ABC8K9A8_ERUVS|nr:unnamed protein product [Eruca vesicaria subsp. sativa]